MNHRYLRKYVEVIRTKSTLAKTLLAALVAISFQEGSATELNYIDMEGNAYIEGDGRVFDQGKSFYFTPAQGAGQHPVEASIAFRGSSSIYYRAASSSSARDKDRSESSVENAYDIRNQARFLSFAFRLDNDFAAPTDWFTFCQFHQRNMGHPPLSLNLTRNSSGQIVMQLVTRHSAPEDNFVARYSRTLSKNTWYKVIIQTNFCSARGNGKLKLIFNDSTVYSNESISLGYLTNSAETGTFSEDVKPKIGVYRSGNHLNQSHGIYFDNVGFFTTLSEAEAVLR
jgi:hypothetical protein